MSRLEKSRSSSVSWGSSNGCWKASVVAELAFVRQNQAINAEYHHLILRCSEEASSARPGQFFQLLCPHTDRDQPFLRRPMSVYGANPDKREVEFLYKITGAGTRGLNSL